MSKNVDFENAMRKVSENDFELAIELFTKALVHNPNSTDVFYNRAVAYLNLEKIDLAIFDFSKLIELDAENAFYYSCRAFAKSRSKDKKGAIADYEIAIKLDPNNPITYNNMGLVQEELGYMEQAKKSFKHSDILREAEENKPKTFGEAPLKNVNSDDSQFTEVEQKSKKEIAKDVFRDKNTFKEFVSFIKNGFKLKK